MQYPVTNIISSIDQIDAYTVVLAYNHPEDYKLQDVLLILKNSPAFLAGRYNGIGGKLEVPIDSLLLDILEDARREFSEETGLTPNPATFHFRGTVLGFNPTGKFFCLFVFTYVPSNPMDVIAFSNGLDIEGKGEVVSAISLDNVLQGAYPTAAHVCAMLSATFADACVSRKDAPTKDTSVGKVIPYPALFHISENFSETQEYAEPKRHLTLITGPHYRTTLLGLTYPDSSDNIPPDIEFSQLLNMSGLDWLYRVSKMPYRTRRGTDIVTPQFAG